MRSTHRLSHASETAVRQSLHHQKRGDSGKGAGGGWCGAWSAVFAAGAGAAVLALQSSIAPVQCDAGGRSRAGQVVDDVGEEIGLRPEEGQAGRGWESDEEKPEPKPGEEKKTDDKKDTKVINVEQELLKRRHLWLHGPIDDRIARTLVMQMMYLESEDPSAPIFLHINSPGGRVSSGLAIYDTMQAISAPVYTVCNGRAFSMAALLLAAGAPGHRYCLPNATVMIHQVSVEYPKMAATDVMIRAEETQRIKHQMNRLFSRHTAQPEDRILEACERDKYFVAADAVEFGLVDKIEMTIPGVRQPQPSA